MENKYIYTLANSGNNIFAGTSTNGVYLSTNNGANWVNTSLNNRVIQKLIAVGNILYAGTSDFGIYLSTNSGINWLQTSLNNRTIYSITSLTQFGSYLFAGGDSTGIYYSSNSGANWSVIGLNGMTIYSLEVAGSMILAGTANFGVYYSSNNGVNWFPTNLNSTAVFSFADSGNIVFAGTSNSIYKSTNFGSNWVQSGLIDELVSEIVISGNNIFAGTFSGGVYVSNDNGMNWNQRNEGLTQLTATGLCISNNFIFTGTQNSVFRRNIGELIGIKQISNIVPENFLLSQNFPNPFNPVTNIRFAIPNAGLVKLTVFDLMGREVETLVNEELNAGTYNTDWNAINHSSGVYFYKLNSEDYSETKRMVLIK
jgi:hypothetical protein